MLVALCRSKPSSFFDCGKDLYGLDPVGAYLKVTDVRPGWEEVLTTSRSRWPMSRDESDRRCTTPHLRSGGCIAKTRPLEYSSACEVRSLKIRDVQAGTVPAQKGEMERSRKYSKSSSRLAYSTLFTLHKN